MKNLIIACVLLITFSNAFAIGPTVVKVKPISSLGHSQIINGQVITSTITELEITFSEEMIDQAGDIEAVDVTNPNNYRLYSTTDDAVVFPADCLASVPANISLVTLTPGFYDSFSNTMALTVSTTIGLSKGRYRLMGCNAGLQSSTVVTFLDGNGTPGDDYVLDFSIKYNNLLVNPNLTQMVNVGWDTTSNVLDGFQDVDMALLQASAQLNPDSATNNDTVISQCVVINGTNKMLFGASVTGYFANGSATLKVEYNDDNVCAGIVIGTFSTVSNYTADLDPNTSEPIWTDSSLNIPVPTDALSAKVSISIDATQPSMLMDRACFVSTLDHVNLSVDENITVTDDVILLPSISLDITENIVVSDNVVLLPSISLDILENILVSDDVQILLPIDLFINENITVTDDVVLLKSISLDITENIIVTDGVVLLPSLSLDISEIITVADDVGLVLSIVPPRVVKVKPIAGLCHDEIQSGDQLASAVTELEITFNRQMVNPSGDTQLIDVNNPDNYRLISSFDPNVVLPTNCEQSLGVNMLEHQLFIRTFDAASETVVLTTAIDTGLPKAYYHLLVCAQGLHSVDGDQLDGNFDGTQGPDYVIDFSVKTQNLLANPNFTDGLTYWTPVGNVVDVVLNSDDAVVAGSAYLDVPSTISQCVAISGVKALRFGTSLIADSDPTQGQLSIEYFNQANCQGETTGIQSNINTSTTGNWRNFALDSRVPLSTVSDRVTVEALNSQTPFMLDRTYLVKSNTVIFKNNFEDEPAAQSCVLQ